MCGYVNHAIAVDLSHSGCFPLPVLFVALYDAKTVDPKKIDFQSSGDLNGILESLRQAVDIDIAL
jgi:hypothetical protein